MELRRADLTVDCAFDRRFGRAFLWKPGSDCPQEDLVIGSFVRDSAPNWLGRERVQILPELRFEGPEWTGLRQGIEPVWVWTPLSHENCLIIRNPQYLNVFSFVLL